MTSDIRRVAVTGASGYVGSQLIRRLDAMDEVEHILATDILPLRRRHSDKVAFVRHDVTEPIAGLLKEHQVDAVAHLAFVIEPGRYARRVRHVNVRGTANLMQACADAGVRHLVCLSSTTVYGAHADNPPLLTEDSPLRPIRGFQYGENKAEIEWNLRAFKEENPDVAVSVLRACPVLGPNADNYVAQTLSRSPFIAIRGYEPQMQFLHEDDLSATLAYCLLNGVDGIYNVGGGGGIGWPEMARIAGKRLVRLPVPLLYGLTGLTWSLRLQSNSPASGLAFIRYPFLASTEKLEREHGLKAKYSSREAWQAFVERDRRRGQ